MILSKKIAAQILEELRGLIKYKINIMDDSGLIIASSDNSRVGSFHAGAQRIIKEHLTGLVVDKAAPSLGIKEGINMPIVYDGEVIGVIGVTGPHREVEQFGDLLKKMADLLFSSFQAEDNEYRRESLKDSFFYEWMNARRLDQNFLSAGFAWHIDIMEPRQFVVIENLRQPVDPETELSVYKRAVDSCAKQYETVAFRYGLQLILLLPQISRAYTARLVEDICLTLNHEQNGDYRAGVDSYPVNDGLLPEHYLRAQAALKGLEPIRDGRVRFYDEIFLELLLDDIQPGQKQEYLRKLFKNCSDSELESQMAFLAVYFRCNGSINQIAEELYMHKNTAQYRIKKLEKLTGFDLRSPRGAAVFYLALLFYYKDQLL